MINFLELVFKNIFQILTCSNALDILVGCVNGMDGVMYKISYNFRGVMQNAN